MIQVFIFNYGHFKEALNLWGIFTKLNYDTYLLNCYNANDPPFVPTDKVISLPNVYYSGQWNEALKRFTASVGFFINSDVKIPNPAQLMRNMEKFYEKQAGIYAPNVYWTPWTYNPDLLPDLENGLKLVPATDSVLWAVSSSIAHKVGPIDLKLNNLGWGIEILAAYYCFLENKYVVRDYSIKCSHPHSTAYNREKADKQMVKWLESLGLAKECKEYVSRRDKYEFGWMGDDKKYIKKPKLFN